MGKRIAAVTAYIARSQPFARPILEHLRDVVHAACPEAEEKMKWSFPHFDYKGMLCSMAAFKQHASFGFWKHALLREQSNGTMERDGMGSFGRLTAVADLPSRRALSAFIRRAMALNDEGVPAPARARPARKAPLKVPAWFTAALKRNRKALATYEAFPPGQQREYLAWVTEAKTEATRAKRLATAIEWMAEGKRRNWKYEKC